MAVQRRWLIGILALLLGIAVAQAAEQTKLTTPAESLGGLRPGTLTVDQLNTKLGKPDVAGAGGLLQLYGGGTDSKLYGWFMTKNPSYTVPDIAVETAKDSNRVDLLMVIGYDGIKTEKGITCFQSEDDLVKAYGKPDFAFSVPMQGYVLTEVYYPKLGISFDLAPLDATGGRSIVAMYITYPEYLARAILLRQKYIKDGVGEDVTYRYSGGKET